jgi:hypothetical protein
MAARFTDWDAADRTLADLRGRFDLDPSDVSVAPLGGSDQPHGSVFLLAGRFRESNVPQVRRIVEGAGGDIVADVDEGWTRPRRHVTRPQRGSLHREPMGR